MALGIRKHRLLRSDGRAIAFKESPNRSGRLRPSYLVMHYTAGDSAAGAIRTLSDPATKASAHLVIARDGGITQLVAFDKIAWHAGRSRWHGLEGMNRFSLGIELVNAGALTRQGAKWRAWFGKVYDDKDVIEAAHQHGGPPRGWPVFPKRQIEATVAVARLLVDAYALRDVIGHDDIAPGRKIDPGPAFPMASVRAAVMGRRDDAPELFQTATHLNLRRGPSTEFDKLTVSPLAPGTRLRLNHRRARWGEVDVLDQHGAPSDSGWVHMDFVAPV